MDQTTEVTSAGITFPNILGCNTGPDTLLSCSNLQLFEIVNLVCLSNIIAVFGVIFNIINIIIFYKQGFTNTVNISFFGMAISDICCLVSLLWVCVCMNPFINSAGVPWIPEDVMYMARAWPHHISGRITSCITVFITAERCLSIITPLKVKQIITPRKVVFVIGLIYIINIITLAPVYVGTYLEYKFFPARNASLLAITFASDRNEITVVVLIMVSITGVSSFVGIIVCTVILVVKLQQSSKWRHESCNDREGTISSREKKTVKMVAIIASVFIICYTPGYAFGTAGFIEPELNVGKKYSNLGNSLLTIMFVFQSVNSSVNIFLYYKMSSNYRQTFHALFTTTGNNVKK